MVSQDKYFVDGEQSATQTFCRITLPIQGSEITQFSGDLFELTLSELTLCKYICVGNGDIAASRFEPHVDLQSIAWRERPRIVRRGGVRHE